MPYSAKQSFSSREEDDCILVQIAQSPLARRGVNQDRTQQIAGESSDDLPLLASQLGQFME